MEPPKYSKVKEMLSCLFRSEYDDRLDEMVKQCRTASEQLYAYTHFKDINTNKLIDNSIFNVVNSILMDDAMLGSKFKIRRNYQYFLDVARRACDEDDHNTAIMIRAALLHHAICQLKLKPRKRDKEIFDRFEQEYGTFRDCYKNHLMSAMGNTDYQGYLPSLMVLNMHEARHRAFSTIGRCKIQYEPGHIKSTIGMHAMHFYYPGETMPLYEKPPVASSTDLILLAQAAK